MQATLRTIGGAVRRRVTGVERPLAVLLCVGAALRLFVVVSYFPGDFQFADGPRLVRSLGTEFFFDYWIPAGYGFFAVALRELWPNIAVLIVAQHLLGLAAGALLYGGMRRLGASPAVACAPAAVVLLGGDSLYAEHVVLTESLYVFGLAAVFWSTARATVSGRLADALLAGLVLGCTGLVRQTALVLVPVVAVWLVWSVRGALRRRLVAGGVALSSSAAVVGAYIGVVAVAGGYTGLTTASDWHMYARVAPIADCSKFRPPPGTENLCEPEPPSQRHGSWWYMNSPETPGARAFGPRGNDGSVQPLVVATPDVEREAFRRWSRAVIRGQTRDYVRMVAVELWHAVDNLPDTTWQFSNRTVAGETAFIEILKAEYTVPDVRAANLGLLAAYQRATRLVGLPVFAALVLTLLGLILGAGATRRAVALPAAAAFLVALAPVATFTFSFRYFLPAMPLLVAAAALGAAALAARFRGRSEPAVPG